MGRGFIGAVLGAGRSGRQENGGLVVKEEVTRGGDTGHA
jgi:hypothetical protein